MRPKTPLSERWASRVNKDAANGCWEWTGRRLPRGYGMISAGGRGGRHLYAHRVSWELASGPIPEGLSVLHRCDNPPCVNPAHLFIGTAKDNADDCRNKGRRAPVERTKHVGEANGRAKITAAEAEAIRERYHALPRKKRVRRGTLTALANEYGLTTTMVCLIVKGKHWATTHSAGGDQPARH